MKRIVIAGGTGFLGNVLARHFESRGDEVTILTRGLTKTVGQRKYLQWDGRTAGTWIAALDGADVLINLNGRSVDCRYTAKNKELIYRSRLDSTKVLGESIERCAHPPTVWINSASATIYRHSLDKEMDEHTGEYGTGFSVDVCQQWEKVFNQFKLPHTRKVLLRTGIVLGREAGPMLPLRMLVRLGAGGYQGPGNQFFSWLHEDDFVSIVQFLIDKPQLHDVFNVTAPNPIPNREFMSTLRNTMGRRWGLPMPRWLLEIGAVIIRTETELVLKSRRVVPRRLLEAGYRFKFDHIAPALADLCQS